MTAKDLVYDLLAVYLNMSLWLMGCAEFNVRAVRLSDDNLKIAYEQLILARSVLEVRYLLVMRIFSSVVLSAIASSLFPCTEPRSARKEQRRRTCHLGFYRQRCFSVPRRHRRSRSTKRHGMSSIV